MTAAGYSWKRAALRRLRAALALLLAGLLLVLVALRWLPVPGSSFMAAYQLKRVLSGRESPPLRYRWVALERISPEMALAVIAAEDQRFPEHNGLDFQAIGRAIAHNSRSSGRVLGASTLTQQVAKNLFLWSGRSYPRKALEAGLALAIDALWPKRRIVEVYLNIAEFDTGVYGVGAAAETLFSTTPDRLAPHQAALLAAALPSPGASDVRRPSAHLRARADWIRRQMRLLGGLRFLDRLTG